MNDQEDRPSGRSVRQLYSRDLDREPMVSREEEAQLLARVRAGCQVSRDRLIRANLRLVIPIAERYATPAMPAEDLIQEGNIALMKAVDRYQPGPGAFATYATALILNHIWRAMQDKARIVRLPASAFRRFKRARRETLRLTATLGRPPTDEELAAATHRPVSCIRADRDLLRVRDQDETGAAGLELHPLAEPVNDNPRDVSARREAYAAALAALRRLDPRERRILTQYFGLAGRDHQTLEAIGQSYGFTRQRANQIKNVAMRRLRAILKKAGWTADAIRETMTRLLSFFA